MECLIQKENEVLRKNKEFLRKEIRTLQDTITDLMKDFGKDSKLGKREVYIVGGGSSLKDFPFERLKDKDTIAVNMSALDVPNPTYCITGDSNIFRKIQEGYFEKIKTTWVMVTNLNHPTMKWIDGRFIHKRSGFVYNPFCVNIFIKSAGCDGIGFSFDDFRTGYNSGFCAFQLAVLLGYERIYLLGIDLLKEGQDTHYHDRYKGKPTISKEAFDKFYSNFVLALEIIKEKTNIEVISCSPISRLNKHIPYQSLEEIV